jgi:hypothetical protein
MDNVGVILRQLLISHDQLTHRNFGLISDLEFISQYDIVFLNCGAIADPGVIRAFVEQGGLVYASDLTMGAIIAPAFPEMGFTYASYAGVVAANILDDGLRVQLGGRGVVNVAIPGGGNIITGWAENAELKVYMDFTHSVRGNIPIIATFEHGAGRVIFTGFHHHRGQTPSDMRRILSHLAFGLYLEDEITAITEIAIERGFSALHPIFGNRPPALDEEGAPLMGEAAEGGWAAGGGGAWEGDVAAAPMAPGMAVYDGGGAHEYVEFENFVHTAVEGETFAIIVSVELGEFTVHLTSPDGYTYTNEVEGVFAGTPPVFAPQPFLGSLEDLGDEMTVISLGAEGLVVVNSIAGNWEFAFETEDENADMFAAGLALGFAENLTSTPGPDEITVLLDGSPLTFDVAPIIVNGRTLVPIRGVFEAMGFVVTWDGNIEQATLARDNDVVIITIGSYMFTTNEAEHSLDVPARIIGDRTMLPLRAVLESVGYELEWNDATRTVMIATRYNISDIVDFGGIAWRILDIRDGKKLLLSEYVLFERAYHDTPLTAVSWETSDIRRYLNNEFYSRFAEYERERIAVTLIENNENPWFRIGRFHNDTYDKIFMLSLEQIVHYLGDSGQLQNRPNNRIGWIADYYSGFRIAYDLNVVPSMWWLRSPGFSHDIAAGVRPNGDIFVEGMMVPADYGVRPALWLNIR